MNDMSARRELHDAAKDLLENRAFAQAILSLRKRWFDQLMSLGLVEEKLELVAKLKALEAIPQELQTLINDYTMAKRHG